MNTSNIKTYAPKARTEFIAAIAKRLNQFGIYADKAGELTISEPNISGSVIQIDGNSFDAALATSRNKLVKRTHQQGFNQFVEHTAYTWFNRSLESVRRYFSPQFYKAHLETYKKSPTYWLFSSGKQKEQVSSTAARNRLSKSHTALEKKQTELLEFDDKLQQHADMQINLGLDDGVKVNYGKFEDLLVDVKGVHGKVVI